MRGLPHVGYGGWGGIISLEALNYRLSGRIGNVRTRLDALGYFAKDHRHFWLEEHAPDPDTEDPTGELLARADRAIQRTLDAGGKVYVFRILSEDEDDLTRPWNEFPNKYGAEKAIRLKRVADHFRRYDYEQDFTVPFWKRERIYWRIIAPPAGDGGTGPS